MQPLLVTDTNDATTTLVQVIATEDFIFYDGFESGDADLWTSTFP